MTNVPDRKPDDDAARAVRFMIGKAVLFGVVPVLVAALIVYFTLP